MTAAKQTDTNNQQQRQQYSLFGFPLSLLSCKRKTNHQYYYKNKMDSGAIMASPTRDSTDDEAPADTTTPTPEENPNDVPTPPEQEEEGQDQLEAPAPPSSPVKNVPWASVKHGRNESIIASIDDIKDACYFLYPDWKTRQSRFWMLLILAAIIATAGVVGDAAATVIGASK